MPVYYPHVSATATPAPAAPPTAPTVSATQFVLALLSNALTPNGGISYGLASGTFNYIWRCRFVNAGGYSPPGPQSSAFACAVGTTYCRLTALPVSSDPTVTGLIIERNSQAQPTVFQPIAYADVAGTYTFANGALTCDDSIPDALLKAVLA